MTQTLNSRAGTGSSVIDASRWPDVASLPAGGIRPLVARRLFQRVIRRLAIQVRDPEGVLTGGGGPGDPVMRLINPEAFYRRIGATGLIGFGESYMAGDWDATDLAGTLTVFARQMSTLIPPRLQRLRDIAVLRGPDSFKGTKSASKANISHHYDLSNDLFKLFLDPSMSYSSALFPADPLGQPPAPAAPDSLQEAQARKIDRLLDVTGVREGTELLEIGTGWGELALRAARRGAKVRSITLSEEQQRLAQQRIAEAGMSDRVEVELLDYRDARGQYDVVISVEMIEAVGFDFMPDYFSTLASLVRPTGRIGLQAITMPHDRMLASRNTWTWILKYIFPGGLCPSIRSIEENGRAADLVVTDRMVFGHHYAQTLQFWRARFEAASDEVEALGFDAVFRRMWSLYLAYSEAGFRSDYLNVCQFVLTPSARA